MPSSTASVIFSLELLTSFPSPSPSSVSVSSSHTTARFTDHDRDHRRNLGARRASTSNTNPTGDIPTQKPLPTKTPPTQLRLHSIAAQPSCHRMATNINPTPTTIHASKYGSIHTSRALGVESQVDSRCGDGKPGEGIPGRHRQRRIS
jgi:hypothetical protein